MLDSSLPLPDPDMQRFMRIVAEDYARFPPFETLNIMEKRRVAALVRARWAQGGPSMIRTRELRITRRNVRVRIYYPTVYNAMPALIYIHGGGWMLFDLDTHDRVMREYASRAGVAVVGVDYSRSPEARFPTAIEEIVGVVRWLRRYGREFDIDPDRLAIGGDSAGANMAVATCLEMRDSGDSQALRAMVLNYGAFQCNPTTKSFQRYQHANYMLTGPEVLELFSGYVRTAADLQHPSLHLLRAELNNLPPAYLAITECDILHDDSIAMTARLRAAGVDVTDIVYPGTVHGFLEAVAIAKVSDRAFTETSQWLAARLA